MRNLYLKIIIHVLLGIILCHPLFSTELSNIENSLKNNHLSPKSSTLDKFIELEKKELFLRNLDHGSSSKSFAFKDSLIRVTSAMLLLQLENLLEKDFLPILENNHQLFSDFLNEFHNILELATKESEQNINQAWENFKTLYLNSISIKAKELQTFFKNYITAKDININNETNMLSQIIKTILIDLNNFSSIFNLTVNCVESPQSIKKHLSATDLITKVIKDLQDTASANKIPFKVSADLFQIQGLINGNPTLLINALANFMNNSKKYANKKSEVIVYFDKKSAEVIFQFNNDAHPIEQEALKKINDRMRIFYLKYSTSGGGVGTTISWYIAQMFNHVINVINSDNGVSFEYRIPVLNQKQTDTSNDIALYSA